MESLPQECIGKTPGQCLAESLPQLIPWKGISPIDAKSQEELAEWEAHAERLYMVANGIHYTVTRLSKGYYSIDYYIEDYALLPNGVWGVIRGPYIHFWDNTLEEILKQLYGFLPETTKMQIWYSFSARGIYKLNGPDIGVITICH